MTAALVREQLTCQNCKRTGEWAAPADTSKTPYLVARSTGWRVWDGETIGGQPLSVRLCPVCAGTATPDQEVTLLGYEAGCRTCGASMTDESDEEKGHVFTEAEAEAWENYHECESDTYITKPAGVS